MHQQLKQVIIIAINQKKKKNVITNMREQFQSGFPVLQWMPLIGARQQIKKA